MGCKLAAARIYTSAAMRCSNARAYRAANRAMYLEVKEGRLTMEAALAKAEADAVAAAVEAAAANGSAEPQPAPDVEIEGDDV